MSRLNDFIRMPPTDPDGKLNMQRWTQFVNTIDRLVDDASAGISSGGTVIVNNTTGGGSGSGGGGGGGSTPSVTLDIAATTVANTISAQVGNFIFRSGSSIGLADNRDLAMQATDYVYATGPGILYITPIYKAKNPTGTETDGRILMAPGKGASSNAILYLYRDGVATDDLSQIQNQTTGRFVNDAKFLQQIAIRTGTPRTVFVTGDVNVHRPGTG